MLTVLQQVRSLVPSEDISPQDTMFRSDFRHHYFYVGRSDILTILNVLGIRAAYVGGDAPIHAILDFGCGYGRVTRWLRAAFPEATIHATDYDHAGVDWCIEKYDCCHIGGDIPRNQFDLVWLGSVFTHLPVAIAETLLQDLLSSLLPNGVLIFTTQGRFSFERMKDFDWANDKRTWMHYGLSREDFQRVVKLYHETGYGYVDYPHQDDYGVCIARPTWYSERVLQSDDFIQVLFQEKGSDNHQDVSAFMRASLVDDCKGPLWQFP